MNSVLRKILSFALVTTTFIPLQGFSQQQYPSSWEYETSLSYSNQEMDWIKFGLMSSVIIFTSEREMLQFVQKNNGQVADRAANAGEYFGSRKMVPVMGAAYVLGMVMNETGMSRMAVLSFKAGIINTLINDSLKQTFRRALPRETDDPFRETRSDGAPSMGMPSGHTSFAFSVATVIAEVVREEYNSTAIPVLAYGAAAITAWSRVYQNQHWASDVLIGAIVGHFSAKLAMSSEREESGNLRVRIYPYYGPNRSVGVMMSISEKTPKRVICRPEEQGSSHCIEKVFNKYFQK